jgi:mannose/fructose/N-acetylgalactosamine-specific phosphotransferase system component IID
MDKTKFLDHLQRFTSRALAVGITVMVGYIGALVIGNIGKIRENKKALKQASKKSTIQEDIDKIMAKIEKEEGK